MNSLLRRFLLLCMLIPAIAGCSGSGSSANAPPDLQAIAGDGVVTASWTMEPGVEYWLFYGKTDSISGDNWTSVGGAVVMNAQSPYIFGGVTNGTTYSFAINARKDGGPGGASSPSMTAVPRLAGSTWKASNPFGSAQMRGIAANAAGTLFAAGSAGALFSGTVTNQIATWTALTNPVPAVGLNDIAAGASSYVAVGDEGTILFSSDAVTWTQKASGISGSLYAVTSPGAQYVAVGAGGTILTSSDGQTWIRQQSGTTSDLYGVAYLSASAKYYVFGARGTLLTSSDGVTWATVNSNTTNTLRRIAFGNSLYVMVGDAGTLVTSTDGSAWAPSPALQTTQNLYAINYYSQFVIAGSAGTVFTSADGVAWTSATSNTSRDIHSLVHGYYGYHAVGSEGLHLSAF